MHAIPAIEGWHDFVRTKDPGRLKEILHRDAVFESPIVHAPLIGRDKVMKYLLGADAVLGTPGFAYANEWRNDHGAALEFTNVIDGVQINGVDLITATDDGRLVTRFTVMIRPLKAIELVHQRMREFLAQAPAVHALRASDPITAHDGL